MFPLFFLNRKEIFTNFYPDLTKYPTAVGVTNILIMNEQLLKFIELCLVDGVISDKEREVIFRKANELGVPEDECEIILEGKIYELGFKESNDSGNKIENENISKPNKLFQPIQRKKVKLPDFTDDSWFGKQCKELLGKIKEKTEFIEAEKKKIPELEKEIQTLNDERLEKSKINNKIRLCEEALRTSNVQMYKFSREKKEFMGQLKRILRTHKIQNTLKILPQHCDGSVYFHNKLNEISSDYNQLQFNKIIRFLDYIKVKEIEYNSKYLEVAESYMNVANTRVLDVIIGQLKIIHNYYSLMQILVFDVDRDTVRFNTVYNFIEDEGIFMTKSEKKTLQYLKGISSQLEILNVNLIKGLDLISLQLASLEKAIQVGFNKLQRELNTISINTELAIDSLMDVSSKLDDVNFNLGEVDKSVPTGNFVSAVSLYQLY